MTEPVTRAQRLQEALLLEQLGAKWNVHHAAAFCRMSVSSLYHSDCPRVVELGDRAIKGRGRVAFYPAQVKEWDAQRSVRAA